MGTERIATRIAVADAGPLIYLAQLDALFIFSALDTLLIPKAVYDELEVGGLPDGFERLSYEMVEADSVPAIDTDLDPGETAALSIAIERSAVLLTDDLDARNVADEADIEVHGSVGLIALGYSRELIGQDEAASLMRSLQSETNLFITDAVIERGIELLDSQE
ncbi:MAG: nucleic acid-binding protein [Euryarchaeota archaeon]|jgi:predicted nucleic acid-binding protein|nr:nucleic acid-binding protein [Euryarchaeota archaeon]